jgi:uncharacterized membrane protein YfcA
MLSGVEILLGLLIGLAVGATRVGGGVLTAPLLILLIGLPSAQSIGTALLFSAIVKANAMLLYLRRKQVNGQVLGYLPAGGVPGAAVGALCLEQVRAAVPGGVILGSVGATVLVSAVFSLLRSWKGVPRRVERLRVLPRLTFPIALETGFSAAGAGALGTVLLFSFTTLSPAAVIGTDLTFGIAVSAVGGAVHMAQGSWNGPVLLRLVVGGLAGAHTGAWLADVLPARILRTLVLASAVVLSLSLLHQSLTSVLGCPK